MSVNDAFVMGAWARDQKTGGKVRMLADGSADFAKATGLTLDLTGRGMGVRSNRYSMLVKDGKVASLNVEAPGKFEVSDAGTLLAPGQGLTHCRARGLPAGGRSEIRLEVVRARDRVVIVGRDLLEAQVLVQRPRRFHVVQRVQQHAGVAGLAGGIERRLGQLAAQAEAAEGLRTYSRFISAAFGIVGCVQRAQRAAAGHCAVHPASSRAPRGAA